MESAVGSNPNPSVLSFLGFLSKGLATSFWNTKSTPLVSWFLFCVNNTESRVARLSEGLDFLSSAVAVYKQHIGLHDNINKITTHACTKYQSYRCESYLE